MSDVEYISDAENNLEVILDGDQADDVENQVEVENNTNGNQEDVDDESKKVVKPKRIVKNPQPKLNAQTLQGAKGLAAIEAYFERVKFKGRGFEEQDLNVLLKTYEYWCHRLFPKFPFDNCIERLETLGTKRATQTQIKRIRMGLNLEDRENTVVRDEDEEQVNVDEETTGFVDTYNDQFDELTSTTTTIQPEPEISEDQLERMRQNMEKAKRLREERLKRIGQNTQSLSEVSNQMQTLDYQFDTSNVGRGKNAQSSMWEDTQNTDNTQMDIEQSENSRINTDNISDNIISDDNISNNVRESQEFNQNEHTLDNTKQVEDNEADIDNILDFINTEDPSEKDEQMSNDQGVNQNEHTSGSSNLVEDTEADIDNILDFINTENPSEKDEQISNDQGVLLEEDVSIGSDRFATTQTEYSKTSNDSRITE